MAVIDAQSAKTSANLAETSQGVDANKKVKGCNRHLITVTLGLVPAVLVTAANVHDIAGGKHLLDDLAAAAHPSMTKSVGVEVLQRPRTQGFEPLPKWWVIERPFGRLVQHHRLARDYEALPQRSRTMIHWAMVGEMSRETTGESIPTWRIATDIPLVSA